ncbi:MAG: glutamate formimidoyltransferase [Anaerolineae bacterium]|nr:glutamate formimidoyltransferase [Anaerolineae bacterium]
MCIPNISEGIDHDTVDQIVAEIRRAKILNVSSNADHNRTVLSYLGEPEDVLAATKAMALKAFELIDMTRHKGSHPRLGAVDVVPFVPVRGLKMVEAVDIARQFGRFAGDMGIPVYYYEEAATCPERVALPDIRRGEYEGLAAKLEDARWRPDEGPAVFNPKSGGLVTGARYPLVAFNVNLGTADIGLAKQIARAVRHSSGGYRFVRAMGVRLKEQGIVQVSMNMVNYAETPLPRVLETIRAEAARYGVNVICTELVGAVPLGVLEQALKYYLQTHDFQTDQIVEIALLE